MGTCPGRAQHTPPAFPGLCALLRPRGASERFASAAMEDDDGDAALYLEEAEAEAVAQLGDTAAEIYAKHRRSTSAESRQVRRRCRAALHAAGHGDAAR